MILLILLNQGVSAVWRWCGNWLPAVSGNAKMTLDGLGFILCRV